MAIVFAKENKRKVISIIILVVLILVFIGLVVVLVREKPIVTTIQNEAIAPPKVNFASLQNPLLLKLEPFLSIPETAQTIGRNNPFVSLATTTATTTKR